ncbi:SEC-C metal-binding domain-containing protein [Clostridium oceanicum]|uniref:SEC-C metal-binding domain-containing protein n=1 Tax=Clostridium oceanicum TaxID=1543 RepID=A0ABN1JSA8_9CLOT
MSLYEQWTNMVVDYVKTKGEAAFWKEYGRIEKDIYTKILSDRTSHITGTLKDLADENDTPILFYLGFLDGINESLTESLDVEKIEENSNVDITLNFEKLYYNMLDAKADYLYKLPQWNAILSNEKRKEIHDSWVSTKTVIKKDVVGRNDPCPCGSGKKYKKCCGKNA